MKRILALLLFLIATSIVAAPPAGNSGLSLEAEQLDRWFEPSASEFSVPSDLLRSIAFVESRWNPPPFAHQRLAGLSENPSDDETSMPRSYGVMGLRFDISSYRGRTVRVYFEAYNDSALQTSFVIDDAAVNVQ